MPSEIDVKGKRVLITGGTDGIGLRLVKRFCDNGAIVAATGSRTRSELPADWPAKSLYVQADQAKADAVGKILKSLSAKKWKSIDYLILNAGVGLITLPQDETVIELRNSFAVNLLTPILLTRAVHPLLENDGFGNVTIIGSTARKGVGLFSSLLCRKGRSCRVFPRLGKRMAGQGWCSADRPWSGGDRNASAGRDGKPLVAPMVP